MIKGDSGVTKMTAKSEMVCNRLLSLSRKAELIVIRYACLWQNAPAQVRVNLSVPKYITAPLRANRKYVYKRWKLHVYKSRRSTKYSGLYLIVNQRLTNVFLKDALLRCKRAPFTLQKSTYYDWVVNLSYKRGEGDVKQSTSDLFLDYQYQVWGFLYCVWLVYV